MANAVALVWDLAAKDSASPAFLRVAGAADKAAAATERASKGMETASARMAAAGAKLSKAVTLPLLGIAAVSVKMAGDFQQSTNVLVTAAGESVKNLAMVRKGILDIATTTGTDWKSVTDGMYQLEKAGYRGAAALQVEKAAAQAAREEGASLSTVTAAATSIMASYHLKASDAVMVMNEMKTAAGESKTTMELFAGSLSTVLPLASANKISFADIAGSLASLTQHGTSADEAAQELAFTMRGLAAPNMVAVKEMAQLGISSLDVARKLGDGPGGRGLAGTLNYLSETVLKRMGKSGMVLLSTFNASKVAAADAKREFDALGPAAQKVAARYLAGSLTAAQWGGAVRKLAAPQAALIRQWATTENSAKGFQQAIKNGVNGSQTYSDALKKMTGGANGLNTVLQLTGESMEGTNHRIATIADAAKGAGKDVQGWASTQKLFNVQMDMLKQKAAATAIQLGTALMPAVMKLVGWVQTGVKWFTNLSGTQKAILGWSLGILAALGPVLAIGGKLLGLFKTIGTAVVWTGTKIAAAFTSVEVASTGMTSNEAVNAAAFARLEAEKAAAAATAAESIAASLEGTGSVLAADSAAAAVDARAFALAQEQKAAAAATAAAAIVGSEEEAGAASSIAFGPIGLALGAVVTAGALAANSMGLFGSSAKSQIKPTDDFTNAIKQDNLALGANTRELVKNKLEKDGAYDAALKLGVSQKTLTDAMLGNASALHQVAVAQRGAQLQGVLWTGMTDKQRKAALALQGANKTLTSAIGDVTTTLKVNERAADNLAAADGKVTTSTKTTASAITGTANSVTHLAATAKTGTSTLSGLALGLSNLSKAKAFPTIGLSGAGTVMSDLDRILARMGAINGVQVVAKISDLSDVHGGRSTGGLITGPGSGTSDSAGLYPLSNGEFVSTDASRARNRAALEAGNRGAKLQAVGGAVQQHVHITQHITRPEGEPMSISLPASMRAAAAPFGAIVGAG